MIVCLSSICFGGISKLSMVRVADDSGIIKAQIIGIYRNRMCTGAVGMKVRVQVADSVDNYSGPKKPSGVLIRRKKETRRKDGSFLKFSENAMVPLIRNKPLGSTIKGPVPLECCHNLRNLARWIF